MTAVAEVLLPEYAEGLFAPMRYKVLYGGRGAARSWSVARALLIRAAAEPTRILCCREYQKSIKDSVHRLLTDQIDLMGLADGYAITNTEIRHENGSLFIFEGLRHNVTKIKSLEGIDVAWVEEAERVTKSSWDVLIPTIRKPGSEIWVNFNPDLSDDPTFARFVVKPPPNAWVQRVSWADNPWFPPELAAEKDYLYAVDPDAAAHVWGGDCRTSSAAQILNGKYIVEPFEPVTDASLRALHGDACLDETKKHLRPEYAAQCWAGPYLGGDFGFASDPNTLVKCWIAPGTRKPSTGRLMIEREAYKVGQDTDAIPEAWQRTVPDCERYTIRADSARPETISYLKRHGFPYIVGAEKWQGSVEDGIAHLRQFEQIVIHPSCTHAADEARHYRYKVDDRTGDVLPDIVDKHNHIWDAVRYALAPMIKQGTTGVLDFYARQAAAARARRDAEAQEHGR